MQPHRLCNTFRIAMGNYFTSHSPRIRSFGFLARPSSSGCADNLNRLVSLKELVCLQARLLSSLHSPRSLEKLHVKFCCHQPQARLVADQGFLRLFWGEQPPFTPIGRGGRYFFGDKNRKKPNYDGRRNDQRHLTEESRLLIRH